MNYTQIKKLDRDTLKKLTEGKGPIDKCLCSVLAPPDDEPKSIKASIKKAFASIAAKPKRRVSGRNTINIPLTFTKGGKGVYSTKQAVKRTTPCRKCGCDHENIVLKHSHANIKIINPDVSSICPCSTDCLPDKAKLANNIKVTIERVSVQDMDSMDSEWTQEDINETPTTQDLDSMDSRTQHGTDSKSTLQDSIH